MIRRILLAIVGMLLLYTFVGFLVIPRFLELEEQAINYAQKHGGHVTIASASFNPFNFHAELEGVKVVDAYGLDALRVSRFYVNIDPMSLIKKRLRLRSLAIEGLEVRVAHFRDGHMSYAGRPMGEDPDATAPEVAYFYMLLAKEIRLEQVGIDLKEQRVAMDRLAIGEPVLNVTRSLPFAPQKRVTSAPEPSQGSPWLIELARLDLHAGRMEFQDFNIPGAAYTVHDNIDVSLENISTAEETTISYDASARLDGSGHLNGSGTLQHTPLVQKGALKIDRLPLKPGASYLERFTYASLESGALSLDINVSFEAKEDGSLLRIDGSHALEALKLTDTRDGSPLIDLTRVSALPVHFSLHPNALEIGTVRVEGLYTNVRYSDAGLNFATLVKRNPAPEAAKQPSSDAPGGDANASEGPGFKVTVEKVVLNDNGADFTDTTPSTPFSTSIRKLEGTVSGLASDLGGRSHIDLKGVIDTYGTVAAAGDLVVADPKSYTELALQMRNLDLNSYTPYAVKFVGRKIDAGRLFLDLGYRIERSQLKGDNGAVIKKIALGEHVESEGALSLPLDLAVALLTDREGTIDIKMPVEGDLDDPDFKYGATVWKTVTNLLSNVATAPFRFLGSLLGIEGDKLESIAFAAGSSELLPPERETLDALSKALKERPGLLLEVSGMYQPGGDTAALQKQKAQALIGPAFKDAKTAALTARLEQLLANSVSQEELKAVRTEVRKEHPEDAAFEAYYREELMRRLVASQPVETTELVALADKRSQEISAYLEASGVAGVQIGVQESRAAEAAEPQWVHIPLGINTK